MTRGLPFVAMVATGVIFSLACGGSVRQDEVVEPSIRLTLADDAEIDPYAFDKGGLNASSAYVVQGSRISIDVTAAGVSSVTVMLSLNARDISDEVTVEPDSEGNAVAVLRLPRPDTVYYVHATGILTDQRPPQLGDLIMDVDTLVTTAWGFRVVERSDA